MVRHNCFDFSMGTSKMFGFEAKDFRAQDVQKKSSEAIPCPADAPGGCLVGPQPKLLSILIL
jgi:hypothetical protein